MLAMASFSSFSSLLVHIVRSSALGWSEKESEAGLPAAAAAAQQQTTTRERRRREAAEAARLQMAKKTGKKCWRRRRSRRKENLQLAVECLPPSLAAR